VRKALVFCLKKEFWPTSEKKCFSDHEKLLVIMKNFCKFDAESREFAESLNKLFKQ